MKNFNDLFYSGLLSEQVPGRKGQTKPEETPSELDGSVTQKEVDDYLRSQGVDPSTVTTGFKVFDDFGAPSSTTPTLASAPVSAPASAPTELTFVNSTMQVAMSKSSMKKDRELLARFQRVAERQAGEGAVDNNLQDRIKELQAKLDNPFDPSNPEQLSQYQAREFEIKSAYDYDANRKIKEAEDRKEKLKNLERRGVGKFVGGGRQLFTSGPKFNTPAEEDAYKKAKIAFDTMIDTAGGPGGVYDTSNRTEEQSKELENLFQQSREASAKVDAERRQAKRISGMYNVTYGDFENAFGHPYDAMNKDDQRLFFDLNSRGQLNVPPTTGVGQGPAYDSLEYQTMRRKPKPAPASKPAPVSVSQDEKEYRTVPASPDEGKFEEIPEPTIPRAIKSSGAELGPLPSPTSIGFDIITSAGIPLRGNAAQQPTMTAKPPRKKEITRGIGAPVNQGINAIVTAAQNAGQKLNDYLKINLAQTMPTTMATKLYGEPQVVVAPISDVQRGQFPIDMYYDAEARTGILDPSIVSRITMPTYNTRTGEFVIEPQRRFQRNSALPLNVQQFMNRLYKTTR